MTPEEGYAKFRGKCREMSEALVKEDPSLRLVRGHYFEPIWGTVEAHWWCAKPDGTIVDPTRDQFPSNGSGHYEEFDGWLQCSECGKDIQEKDAQIGGNGHYAFCGDACHMRFVGL